MTTRHTWIPSSIWNDPNFRTLTAPAQHLLLMAYTAPTTNQAGIMDWRPKRLAALTHGATQDEIVAAGTELDTAELLIIDPDTEEAGITTWFRTTFILKQPYVAMNAINLLADTASLRIRQAIINELHELNRHQPPLAGLQTDHAQEFLRENPEK